MSLSAEAAENGAADEVALNVEDVVYGGVDGDEALGGYRRLLSQSMSPEPSLSKREPESPDDCAPERR